MKTSKHRPLALGLCDSAREREVQQEIENFRKALTSYPDHFAHDPGLSFEEHLLRLAAQANRDEMAAVDKKAAAPTSQLAAHA